MNHEGERYTQTSSIDDEPCPCPYFNALLKTLPENLQDSNIQYRLAAIEGREVTGLGSLMCRECIRNKKVQGLIALKINRDVL